MRSAGRWTAWNTLRSDSAPTERSRHQESSGSSSRAGAQLNRHSLDQRESVQVVLGQVASETRPEGGASPRRTWCTLRAGDDRERSMAKQIDPVPHCTRILCCRSLSITIRRSAPLGSPDITAGDSRREAFISTGTGDHPGRRVATPEEFSRLVRRCDTDRAERSTIYQPVVAARPRNYSPLGKEEVCTWRR